MRNAMRHAGSSVVFSGTTVAISLLALVALPVPFLRSIGIAGLLIPLVSVAVAATLLPVVLATVGPRLDRPRGAPRDRASRGWSAWARLVVRTAGSPPSRRPPCWPRSSSPPPRSSSATRAPTRWPRRTRPRRARALQDSGIGTGPLSPFDALVRAGDADGSPRCSDGRRRPQRDRAGGVAARRHGPGHRHPHRGRQLPRRPRDARAHWGDAAAADVTFGGEAAQSADFLDAVYGNFPLMIALISVLTFVLLARAFRSLLLPLKAVLLNLLSVAAAWGLIVLVFQHGFGSEAIWGIEATRPSTSRCRS